MAELARNHKGMTRPKFRLHIDNQGKSIYLVRKPPYENIGMEKREPPAPKKRKKITLSYLENAGAYYLERFSASEAQFRKVMGQKIYKSCQ